MDEKQRLWMEKLFQNHHSYFLRISQNIVRSIDAAEDVVSASYLKMMKHFERISGLSEDSAIAFCVTIVKNTSVDYLRRNKQYINLDETREAGEAQDGDMEDQIIREADVGRLTELIEKLPDEEKRIIYMHYVVRLGYARIGKQLGVSEEAARKRGQRVIKKLREWYDGR